MKKTIIQLFSLTLLLSSCSTFKADPHQPTDFVEKKELLTAPDENHPFSWHWKKAEGNAKDYFSSVYFDSVNLDYLNTSKKFSKDTDSKEIDSKEETEKLTVTSDSASKEEKGKKVEHTAGGHKSVDKNKKDSSKEQPKKEELAKVETTKVEHSEKELEDAQEIAQYILSSFKEAVTKKADPGMRLAERPDSKTLVVKFALVELKQTNRLLNTLGTAGGFVKQGVGLVGLAASKGSIAIEMKVYNNKGELLGEVADREMDSTSLFNVNDYSKFGHAKTRIDEWASQFVELLTNTSTSENEIEDSSAFTIKPW